MDPNTARAQIIDRANMILAMVGREPDPTGEQVYLLIEEATALAESIHGLDEWLRSGGFFPHAWQADSDSDLFAPAGRKQDVP